jgi:hypothetical protein
MACFSFRNVGSQKIIEYLQFEFNKSKQRLNICRTYYHSIHAVLRSHDRTQHIFLVEDF